MSTRLRKRLSITTCLFFVVMIFAITYRGSARLSADVKGGQPIASSYDAGLDTSSHENSKHLDGITESLALEELWQYNFGENGVNVSRLSSFSNDDDDDDDDHDDDHHDDDDDTHDDDDDDDHDDDDDDGSTNYFSDTALYRIPTRYGSTTIIELEHYLVPGVTGITFALVSCDSSRADYYDSVQVENGKLVLESNTVGHIHGSNTESETVCTVAGKGRARTHQREFHFYTVSDRKPLTLNGLSVTTVRVTEVDIQITTSAPGNYVRLGWRKTGSRPTFRIASLGSGTATVTIPGLEPETDYEIRAYSMTRQAFDLYRGGNSGSLISEITPPSKWIANLSGGGLGPSRSLTVTTTQLNRAPTAVGTFPSQTVPDGGTDSVDVSNYFSDPDRRYLDLQREFVRY